MENIQVLINILQNTFSSNQQLQHQAEHDINQLCGQPGFMSTLLQIAINNNIPHPIRLAAVIYLKNFVSNQWNQNNNSHISENDKIFMKQNILQAIVHTPQQLKVLLCCALQKMIVSEYPVRWSNLVDDILQMMSSNDINRTYGSLLALLELFKSYRTSREEEHKTVINNLISRTFNVLVNLQQYLLQQEDTVNSIEQRDMFAQMRLIIAKIFWYSMSAGTPSYFFHNINHFELWMQLFMATVKKLAPPEHPNGATPYWKTIQWHAHIAYRLLSVHSHPNIVEEYEKNVEQLKKFSNYFLDKFAIPWLSIFVHLLETYNTNRLNIPNRILALALTYIHGVIQNKKLYESTLKPKLSYLISNIVFPFMCFTAADAELWETDPEEYQREAFQVIDDIYSPKAAAASIIIDLISIRKNDALPVYLSFVNTELNKYNQEPPQNRNYALKDGILFSIGSLRNQLKKAKQTRDSLEMMLLTHVFPEFENPRGFMRAKACWILGQFSTIRWSKPENMINGLRKILSCLGSNELPVKVQAGLALTDFLNNPAAVKEVRPILPQLLQVFLQNMNEMEHERVVQSIELLIDAFHEDMEPYAISIIQKMNETFLRLLEDEENDEAEFVMISCLRSILTLVGALHNKTHMFPSIGRAVYPIIFKILESSDQLEFLSEGLELLTNLTYYCPSEGISQELWQLFPMMGNIFKECAYDYIADFVAPIDNFVSKDPNTFMSNPTYLDMVMYMINIFLSDKEASEKDMQSAVKLVSVLLQYLKGRIDHIVPKLLELLIGCLSRCSSTSLKILLLDAIADAILYNSEMVCTFMEQTKCTASVFALWLNTIPKFKRLYDKKLTVLALSHLLSRPEISTLPPSVQTNVGLIICNLVKILIDMQEQKKREEEDEIAQEKERQEFLNKIQNGYVYGEEDEDEEYEDEDAFFQRQLNEEADIIDGGNAEKADTFKELISKLKRAKEEINDEEEDEDDLDDGELFSSAIDHLNENELFGSAIKAFSERYPEPFKQIVMSGKLDSRELSTLQQLMAQ
jgi:hypothetical protein